jgi:hypothetical protein
MIRTNSLSNKFKKISILEFSNNLLLDFNYKKEPPLVDFDIKWKRIFNGRRRPTYMNSGYSLNSYSLNQLSLDLRSFKPDYIIFNFDNFNYKSNLEDSLRNNLLTPTKYLDFILEFNSRNLPKLIILQSENKTINNTAISQCTKAAFKEYVNFKLKIKPGIKCKFITSIPDFITLIS